MCLQTYIHTYIYICTLTNYVMETIGTTCVGIPDFWNTYNRDHKNKSCPSGYSSLIHNTTCIQNCPSGHYDVGTTCVKPCPSGTQEAGTSCIKDID